MMIILNMESAFSNEQFSLLLDYDMTSLQLDKCESVRRNRKTDIFVSRSLPGDNLPRRVQVHCQGKTMSDHSTAVFYVFVPSAMERSDRLRQPSWGQ